jgi:hypothetical protein
VIRAERSVHYSTRELLVRSHEMHDVSDSEAGEHEEKLRGQLRLQRLDLRNHNLIGRRWIKQALP